jgi:hypothetical protein
MDNAIATALTGKSLDQIPWSSVKSYVF